MDHRSSLRQHYRQLRRALTPRQQAHGAKRLLETLLDNETLANTRCLAGYLANDGELNLSTVVHYCWEHGITFCLPVLHPFSSGHLLFLRYHPNSQMIANKFGIAEPRLRCPDVIPLKDIDMVLTPLVAFDEQGNRLGMGGGFYDRTLAAVERDGLQTQILGVAHDCQLADSLPHQSWDIPLHGVVTPTQIFKTSEPQHS